MNSILRIKKGKLNLPIGGFTCSDKQESIQSKSIPKIVPLFDGQELKINQKLIMNGLSTISVRNMKSKGLAIKERNSFFNLHRPELKGLNIAPTENKQEKILQKHILKEVKTIHKIKSMKSLCSINESQRLSANNQENNIKSEAALLMEKRFLKRLKPIVTKIDEQNKRVDYSDSEDSILEADKFCQNDVEVKSILIG